MDATTAVREVKSFVRSVLHRVQINPASRRREVLRSSFERFQRDPSACLSSDTGILSDLKYGWGNEIWSGSVEFLKGCIQEALRCQGGILECGSGLTTLVVGAVADQTGVEFVSLEHSQEWGEHVGDIAATLGIRSVSVRHAPLKDYNKFSWYSLPQEPIGPFSLVLCDGPPGGIRGGRYGLLPVAKPLLSDPCVILLDDGKRDEEQSIARRWEHEGPMRCEKIGDRDPYFRLTRPARPL